MPKYAALARPLARLAVLASAAALAVTATAAPPATAKPEPKAPKEFVALSDVDPTILHDIRYYTRHNFTGERIDGYRKPMCLLTGDAARMLKKAQREFRRDGYTLKVYDCYRPQRAVDQFVEWAEDLADQRMKDEFYPRVDKSRLFEDGYIAARSGHSRGSVVDLTLVKLPAGNTRPYEPGEPLVDCAAPWKERFPDNSIDMATGYDCFDTLSHTLDERVQGTQRANRLRLKEGLEAAGFVNYEYEWWHFGLANEPFPDTYFDFPVHRRSLSGNGR
ncbi:M15 family metallopeptidase [Streptomyces sp. 184]|uniref:M15 family metallopeptidase n=1 Tax=Streptomyces sp. 184 TaxID=1827526 RepID=UPI003892135E